MNRSTSIRALSTAAFAVLALAVGAATPYAGAASPDSVSRPTARDSGLAQRVVVKGLCDGHARYRVVLHNEQGREGRYVAADVTIRQAGKKASWDFWSLAQSEFANGTGVTGNGDGFAKANAHGVIRLHALTPAGVSHLFEFGVTRSDQQDFCFLSIKA